MDENRFTGMTDEELEAAKQDLTAQIKRVEALTHFVTSKVGKGLIADKKADLLGIRNKYAGLDVNAPAEKVVLALAKIQVSEKMLADEVARYENTEKLKVLLDKRMLLWYDTNKSRESFTRVER